MRHYLGKWKLIPELSHYDVGQAPESGTYFIEEVDDQIAIAIHWTSGGKDMSVQFSGPADGRQIESGYPGIDSYSVLHEDDYTLSGDAMTGDAQVSRAIRRVSMDGNLMSIIQENAGGNGEMIRIYQVYQRIG